MKIFSRCLCLWICYFQLFWFSTFLPDVRAEKLTTNLAQVVYKYSTGKTGISIVHSDSYKDVFSHNEGLTFKPASVQKLVTSAVALQKLGPDFRFNTKFYVDRLSEGAADTLYIKGGGDPNLRTEDLWVIAKKLQRLGLLSVKKIVVDDSFFVAEHTRSGQRAYEAGSSALSFNFNSITFELCTKPSDTVANIQYEPSELKIPLQGRIFVSRKGRSKFGIDELSSSPLSYRLKGTIRYSDGCTEIYRSVPNPPVYFGETLKEYLKLLGVKVFGMVKKGPVSGTAKLFFEYESKALDLIVEDLNRFSNNFIGEQLVAAMGRTSIGSMDRRLGLAMMANYVERLGFNRSEFVIADGSGLSHSNRLSPRILTSILYEVQHLPVIKPEFEKSLSVVGKSGTLKDRNFKPAYIIIRGKTGTLNGVSSLAGYVYSKNGRKLSFAILQNGVKSKARANLLEEKLLFEIANTNL